MASVVTDVFMVDVRSPASVTVGVAAVAAVATDVFMVAVWSPSVGALVRFVAVVVVLTRGTVVLLNVVAVVACLMLVKSGPTCLVLQR